MPDKSEPRQASTIQANELMGSRVAEQTGSSRTSNSAQDDPRSHVVIVPARDLGGASGDDSGTFSAELPFLGEQHETIVSKQRPGSSDRLSLEAALAHSTLNPAEMGSILKGEMLGHFRLEDFVGGGGMGVVFRATDVRLGRVVAVKILTRDRTDADTLRRFQNEAQSAARLDHENIARVYYVGEDRGLHFIVFEFIEGINIRDLVNRDGPLPVDKAVSYLLQVAEALEHASMRNVIHRDIKPSNVLITVNGRAKLVDMGLARLHQLEPDAGDLTASGVTLGTFDYISPEQARDPRTADVRSDLYSLGCTFYFMLTGRPPFPEGTVLQKLLSHSTEDPTDPRMFRPDLDDQIVRTLQRLLAKQPAQRYQRASELISHLLLVAERLNLGPVARNGLVSHVPRNAFAALLLTSLPWALPTLLFITGVLLLSGLWNSPEPFELAPSPIRLSATTKEATELARTQDQPADIPEVGMVSGAPLAEPRGEQPVPPSPAGTESAADLPGQDQVADSQTAEISPDAEQDAMPPVAEEPPVALDSSGSSASQPRWDAPEASGPDASTPDVGAWKPEAPVEPQVDSTSPPATPSVAPAPADSITPPPGLVAPPPDSVPPADGPPQQEPPPLKSPVDPSAVVAQEVTKIVVSDHQKKLEDGVLLVPSLAVACREAHQLGVKKIELHFDGPREEAFLDIQANELTISSGPGYQPLIVFRPRAETASAPHAAAIHARGNQLVWQNVQILLDLSGAPSHPWALFRLHSVIGLELQNSVLTIRNVDAQGTSLHHPVAFISIEARPYAEPGDERKPQVPHYVNFSNTIIRGQATVVHARHATAFRLYAQDSLVVTRNYLTDIEGIANLPSLRDGRIDIVLRHTTIAARSGLVRMGGNGQTPHPLDLFTDIADSIVLIKNRESPVFQRVGTSQVEAVENRLDLRGRDNFYPGSTILLRLGPDRNSDALLDFDLDQRDQLPFVKEKSPHLTLIWKGLPGSELSEERHVPAHYELDQSEFNPAYRPGREAQAGASIKQLPNPLPIPFDTQMSHSVSGSP
jgi:serine/threonine protein kinase